MAKETFNTVLGPTKFVNGFLDKEAHLGEVGQWQKGDFEVVGPTKKATAPFIYPKPDWPAAAPARSSTDFIFRPWEWESLRLPR